MGDGSARTGMNLWKRIEAEAEGIVYADYRKPYKEIVPKEKSAQTKKETYTVESCNSPIRHFSARFGRKTKMLYKKYQNDGVIVKAVDGKKK